MITNEYLYYQFPDANIDVARMGSYVISGIGFLGAGSIIKDGFRVRGLTTAAGLWVVACLGVAVGAGFYWAALFGGLVVFMVLVLLKLMERKFISGRNRTEIELRIKNTPETLAEVMTNIGKAGLSVKDIDMQSTDKKWTEVIIDTTITNKLAMDRLKESLKNREDVKVVSIEIVK